MRLLAAVTLSLALVSGCAANSSPESPQARLKAEDPPVSHTPTTSEPARKVSIPKRIRIPAIGVDAEIIKVGLKGKGKRKHMETPPGDKNLAGWFSPKMPAGEKPFPRPGEDGPAVIAAHVDSRSGPDVFARLKELRKGSKIQVTDKAGKTYTFVMERMKQAPKDQLDVDAIWGKTDGPALRLITCGGDFDKASGHYVSNVIVWADAA